MISTEARLKIWQGERAEQLRKWYEDDIFKFIRDESFDIELRDSKRLGHVVEIYWSAAKIGKGRVMLNRMQDI